MRDRLWSIRFLIYRPIDLLDFTLVYCFSISSFNTAAIVLVLTLANYVDDKLAVLHAAVVVHHRSLPDW